MESTFDGVVAVVVVAVLEEMDGYRRNHGDDMFLIDLDMSECLDSVT